MVAPQESAPWRNSSMINITYLLYSVFHIPDIFLFYDGLKAYKIVQLGLSGQTFYHHFHQAKLSIITFTRPNFLSSLSPIQSYNWCNVWNNIPREQSCLVMNTVERVCPYIWWLLSCTIRSPARFLSPSPLNAQ